MLMIDSLKKEVTDRPMQGLMTFAGVILAGLNFWFFVKVTPVLNQISQLDGRITLLEKIVSQNQPQIDEIKIINDRQVRMQQDLSEIKFDIKKLLEEH